MGAPGSAPRGLGCAGSHGALGDGAQRSPMAPRGTLRLREQTATASLRSAATPLGEILVYLVGAQPSVRAHGHSVTASEAAHARAAAAAARLHCFPLPLPSPRRFSLPSCVLPTCAVQGLQGCEGNAAAEFTTPRLCATARKAFPSSRITAGYPTPNTGCGHISQREGARTPPLFVPHQRKMPALPCCLDRARPPPPRQWGPWAVGTPGSPFGSTWVPMSYLGVSHLLPQPLLPGMLRMQKLTAAQTSFYPYIVSAYTLPS